MQEVNNTAEVSSILRLNQITQAHSSNIMEDIILSINKHTVSIKVKDRMTR